MSLKNNSRACFKAWCQFLVETWVYMIHLKFVTYSSENKKCIYSRVILGVGKIDVVSEIIAHFIIMTVLKIIRFAVFS